jgi:serine/threonine protein kinase
MGAVLKALHPTLKRHVVLKKLTIRGSSAIAERFKRDARILNEFQHDNVVRVFDCGCFFSLIPPKGSWFSSKLVTMMKFVERLNRIRKSPASAAEQTKDRGVTRHQ